MEIRRLSESDATAFWELRLRSLQEDPEAFTASFEEANQRSIDSVTQDFRARLNSRENFVLGAFIETHLVGIVGFYREQNDKIRHKGKVWGMYVAPEVRGQGIGKALLAEAITRARLLPALEQIQLGVVTSQTAARRLYASLGFVAFGLEPRAVKVGDRYLDEEWMALRLI